MKLLVLGVDIYVVQWFMSFEILCLKRTSDYATHNYCSKISDRINYAQKQFFTGTTSVKWLAKQGALTA